MENKFKTYASFASYLSKQKGLPFKEVMKSDATKLLWKEMKNKHKSGRKEPSSVRLNEAELRWKKELPKEQTEILKAIFNPTTSEPLLGKSQDTGLERSYLEKMYSFLSEITPEKYQNILNPRDYNLNPISSNFYNLSTVYEDSPYLFEFSLYKNNPVNMFPGKREMKVILNDLGNNIINSQYIKSINDRTVKYSAFYETLLNDWYNLQSTIGRDVSTIYYNDNFYTNDYSLKLLFVYILYLSGFKGAKLFLVTSKDYGNNLKDFYKKLDIVTLRKLNFGRAFKDVDIVNVVNYLAGRNYKGEITQPDEQPVGLPRNIVDPVPTQRLVSEEEIDRFYDPEVPDTEFYEPEGDEVIEGSGLLSDDIDRFSEMIQINSIEKLPSITKSGNKNVYLFRF